MLMASFPKAPSRPQAQQEAKQVRSKSKEQPKRSCPLRTCGLAEPRGLGWSGAQEGIREGPEQTYSTLSLWGFICLGLFACLFCFGFSFSPPDHNHVSKLYGCHSTKWELRIWIYIWIHIKKQRHRISMYTHPQQCMWPSKILSLTTRTKPSLADHNAVQNQCL